ncbi:MAG: calcium/sodium antiporter [Deltaproteobacteria bacterium]|nr:calcium/sodium antiporter [Deltaproteobacteria bacterium]
MPISLALLVVGFALLAKGGDFLVDGASSIAKHFKVSELVIGLTIVSLGTSAPELLVNIIASVGGSSGIALGNVFGSNICNTLLILGVAAVIAPISVQRGTVWKEIPFSLFITFVLGLLLNDTFFGNSGADRLSRGDGFVLLVLFGLFMYYVFTISSSDEAGGEDGEIADMGLGKSSVFIVLGLVGLVAGGKLVVTGAVDIARTFGVSEALIGLTIVAIGTSLPELFASAMAAYRGKSDIAIGNVVGSNIFNVLFVLGISSVIKTIPYPSLLNADLALVVLSIFFVFAFMFSGRKHRLERWEGALLVFTYFAYMVYLGIRE